MIMHRALLFFFVTCTFVPQYIACTDPIDLDDFIGQELQDLEQLLQDDNPKKDPIKMTLREKLELFMALPRDVKIQMLKDYIKQHPVQYGTTLTIVGYIAGLTTGILATLGITALILRKKKKP